MGVVEDYVAPTELIAFWNLYPMACAMGYEYIAPLGLGRVSSPSKSIALGEGIHPTARKYRGSVGSPARGDVLIATGASPWKTNKLESSPVGATQSWDLPMGHTYHAATFHIIFSTKMREGLITKDLREDLHAYLAGAINNEYGMAHLVGGTTDHVHILADLKPKFAPSDVLRNIKANSSGWIHKTYPAKRSFAWQSGYGIFSVSRSLIPKVREYILNQEEHHRTLSFQDEYLKFLDKHGIEYDSKYIWD